MARAQAQQQQQEAIREQKKAMIAQFLDDAAQARLGAIAAAKPDKAEKIESVLISNAQRGAIQGKVTESQLIDLLEQIG